MKIERAIIYTDGVAQPNPGAAAIGVFIQDDKGEPITSISRSIGYATNNQAEYRAIIAGLEMAISMGIEQVNMRADSELVVRQINGSYRVKNTALKPLYQRVKQLQGQLKEFSINHIPRQRNKEADRLASKAL